VDIGGNIKRIRESKGLSQERLAETVGISPALLSLYENNRRKISAIVFIDICHALGATIEDVAPRDEESPSPSPVTTRQLRHYLVEYGLSDEAVKNVLRQIELWEAAGYE